MSFSFQSTVEALLAGIREGAGDLLRLAGENETFFRILAQDYAEELGRLVLASTEAEKRACLANLTHLRAQAEVRLATIAARTEKETRDKIVRVVTASFSALTKILHR